MKKILIAIFALLVAITGIYFYVTNDTSKPIKITKPAAIEPVKNDLSTDTPKLKYSMSYKAEGNFENLYKNLIEVADSDKKIEIISYAKSIAKEAGYSISGDNLDKYKLNDMEYPMEIIVYENSEFYIVSLLPIGTPTTSNNLEIGIQKSTNKIISILKGS